MWDDVITTIDHSQPYDACLLDELATPENMRHFGTNFMYGSSHQPIHVRFVLRRSNPNVWRLMMVSPCTHQEGRSQPATPLWRIGGLGPSFTCRWARRGEVTCTLPPLEHVGFLVHVTRLMHPTLSSLRLTTTELLQQSVFQLATRK